MENVIKRRHAGSGLLQMSHRAHVNERAPFICRTTAFFLSKTLHFDGSKWLVFLNKLTNRKQGCVSKIEFVNTGYVALFKSSLKCLPLAQRTSFTNQQVYVNVILLSEKEIHICVI